MEHEKALRSGELGWVHPVAQAYLGLFSDMDKTLPPMDRIGQWLGPELESAALAGFDAVLSRPDLPTVQQIAESYAESRRWHIVLPMIAAINQRLSDGRGLGGLSSDIFISVLIALANEHLGDRISDRDIITRLETELRHDPEVFKRYVRFLIEPSLERQRTHISGLYAFLHSARDNDLARHLAAEWLQRYPDLPSTVELEFLDVLAKSGDLATLRVLHHQRIQRGLTDVERRRNWDAVGIITDFDDTAAALGTISVADRDLVWHMRQRLGAERRQEQHATHVPPRTLAWIIRQFRTLWPRQERPGGGTSGNTNAWDAAEFLETVTKRLSADPTAAAADELSALVADTEDGYTPALRYSFDQQRRARREINFPGVTLDRLKDVVEARPPRSTDDLLAIVRHALHRLQEQLRGNDTDTVDKYWRDNGQPRDEDSCTDLLIEDIERLLPPYGIGRTPQRDMPQGKRADIVFTVGNAALPIECKGQWNPRLWSAASGQLDAFYLRDWRSQDRGIYLVYWFGVDVASARRLKLPPSDFPQPATPDELRAQLLACLAPARHGSIAIEVLDLTR